MVPVGLQMGLGEARVLLILSLVLEAKRAATE